MRIDQSNRLPETLVASLDPARLQQYVRATGWKLQPHLGRGLVAVFERPETRLAQVSVPLTSDLSNFAVVQSTALAVLATWEQRPARDILDELRLSPADLVRFSESGPEADLGHLPFDYGLNLIAGVRKVLLSVACNVIRPQSFHLRLSLAESERFVQTCRLIQTDQERFTITLACPLDQTSSLETHADRTPFARQVTTLLMRSLHRLKRAIESGDPDQALVPVENEPLLSANLCEALLEMMPERNSSALTITANWSRMLPPTDPTLPLSVKLGHDFFPRIEGLARRLRPTAETARQAILGLVETLNGRLDAVGRVEGEVILTILAPDGETLRVRADLKAADYAAAAEAHLRALPVSLQGVLNRSSRVPRIENVSEFKVYPRLAPSPLSESA